MYWLWDPDPVAFVLGDFVIGWYGILFALGFLFAQRLVIFMYRKEGKPGRDLDALLIYLIIGTVVGARLGHCLFYDPQIYLRNPLSILKIWEGGLASHGAAAGLLIACAIFARRKKDQPFLWLVDRITIVAALVGSLVRIGNFINSEIIGTPTGLSAGVVFLSPVRTVITGSGIPVTAINVGHTDPTHTPPGGIVPVQMSFSFPPDAISTAQNRRHIFTTLQSLLQTHPASRIHLLDIGFPDTARADPTGNTAITITALAIARHPVQLYEAAAYLTISLVLFLIWWRHKSALAHGALLGWLFVSLFSSRFFLEYLKVAVTPIEVGLPVTMGQILSIPFVGIGLWLVLSRRTAS